MFDDLAAYYHEDVVTAFVAYRDVSKDGLAGRSRDLRSALIAATALFHLREHLPEANALTRSEVEKRCPDYALLGDIVNAAKHRYVKNSTPHGGSLVPDATKLGEQLEFIEYEDDAGSYRYIQKTVVVKLADGSERYLHEILTNVINYWEQYLFAIGVLLQARTFVHDNDIRARSRAECDGYHLNFELVQGQRFHQRMRLLHFNNKTGKAEPIDLTGAKVSFKAYRPKLDIQIFLTKDSSGEEFKRSITLTEEESAVSLSMPNDASRQAYIEALPSVQAALQQLAVEAGLVTKSRHGNED